MCSRPELRDPRRLGKVLPLSVAPFKRHMPLLMHGKRITFGETVSQQNEHKTPAVFYPNVIHAFVYSRLLNMSILIKMSTTALREIEYSAGGLDEYLLTVSDAKLGDDWIARMYRDKVREAWKEKYATGADDGISESRVLAKGTGDRILPISKKAYEEFQILSHYGEEYMR